MNLCGRPLRMEDLVEAAKEIEEHDRRFYESGCMKEVIMQAWQWRVLFRQNGERGPECIYTVPDHVRVVLKIPS